MAERSLTRPTLRLPAGMPLSLQVAALYVGARIITTGLLLAAAALSGPGSRFGADATVGDLLSGWDAQWYWLVAVAGYPAALPITEAGLVAENAWAFLPVYPAVAAVVGLPLGSWVAGAGVVSLLAGYGATYVLCRLLTQRIGRAAALWSAAMFACAPLAAMFHVGYAESLFLLVLMLGLWAVARRRYGWLYALVPLMGFTRPGVLAFSLFLALHGIHRWLTRRTEPLPARDVVNIVVTGLLAAVVGFSWIVIAGAVTGHPDAYLSTELAWRRSWLPDAGAGFVPFEGFVQGSAFWAGVLGLPAAVGVIVLVLLVGLTAVALWRSRYARALGVDLRLWSASYLLYLLAVFFPQSSTWRLLLPLSPLWGAVAVPRSTAWRVGVLALCLAGQAWWIYEMYALGNTFWRVP
ncbi:hypothetical protein NQ166_06470 [Microbacterium sp. zg.Y1090]|uniref:hypothetical protein n=1 Tax=Microbacterium TaxID=33882 RepID=UPI00214B408A|nr:MULTISPECIES: hypothetical protein [unclassified Microbacterium]MCR2812078.1 hypothetical protein [Microbacterium sp. zg.Y1084]MCR2818483.1 hypothetical protein [Microbacterium sp. zg.Y1090]MDL5486296.1 hypothetical protein [Microbacterium sp. zg-Y1211]WIM29492.1 hypothetical protein QNO26_06280 [Microbacterium sp. zg-Y1090]